MPIKLTVKGDWSKVDGFFERMKELFNKGRFDEWGQMGVDALREATPKRTGLTSESWSYEIKRSHGRASIEWYNSNTNDGNNIAILIQYGHGTRQGAWVEGRDYINPAMVNVFEEIAKEMWEEVTKA